MLIHLPYSFNEVILMKRFKIIIGIILLLLFIKYQGIQLYNTASDILSHGNISNIEAYSAVAMDMSSKNIILSKNLNEKMYPASTTKILTAVLAVKYGNMNDNIVVGNEIYKTAFDASKAGLKCGEIISLHNLIRGLLIPSGNDAAYTIAVYIARKASGNQYMSINDSINYFCQLMNKEAYSLGAVNSHFINPDGYHNINHYTTAYDLALIARKAFSNPFLRQVMDTPFYSYGSHTWINTDKLIQKNSKYYYGYVIAGKTGHTSAAGNCLVTASYKNRKTVIVVIMKSTQTAEWSDSKKLIKCALD